MRFKKFLSECRDSNPESLAPKASMLAVTLHSDNSKLADKDKLRIER